VSFLLTRLQAAPNPSEQRENISMLDNRDVDAGEPSPIAPQGSTPPGLELIELLISRRSVSPVRLGEPGPSPDEVRKLLTVATRVPDHGILQPWRIILVQGTAREKLGARLAAVYLKTNAQQEPASSDLAIRKLNAVLSAPLVGIVVSKADPSARIPEWEQVLSAGAVCMNLIVAASALGYGSTWLTGWAAYNPAALRVLGVEEGEKVAGIIPIGTAGERQQERVRPSLQKLLTMWTAT
jgi:nitroreductase